jgi:hypothetical protein
VGSFSKLIFSLGGLVLFYKIHTSANQNVVIQFGTILDNLYSYPDNKPTNETRIRFQKCQSFFHITDPVLKPLIEALNASKRDTLVFSPITKNDWIEVDGSIGTGDVWMHVYNDLSTHDIFFRFRGNIYTWVFEQENFYGPDKWVDYDGAQGQEEINGQYQTEEINGGSVNKLMITYFGHDPRLNDRAMNWYLSNNISDVYPILEEWKQWRNTQPPSPESLCP